MRHDRRSVGYCLCIILFQYVTFADCCTAKWVQQFLHVVFEAVWKPRLASSSPCICWPDACLFPAIYADRVCMYFLPIPLPLCVPVLSQSMLIVCICISCKTLCSPGAYVYPSNHSGDQMLTYFHPIFMLTRCLCISCQSFWRPGVYLFPPSLYANEVFPVSQLIFNGREHLLSVIKDWHVTVLIFSFFYCLYRGLKIFLIWMLWNYL